MFRKMRRSAQLLSDKETVEMFKRATSATLALHGDDDYPYSVPVSFVYHDHKIYFHGAKEGHKVDSIRRNAKASISVIDLDQIVPEAYTTYFRSAIAFGKITEITDEVKMHDACVLLAQKYRPGYEEDMENEIKREFPALAVFEFDIEYLTGKEAIELVKARKAD